jgi:hypothetical protein
VAHTCNPSYSGSRDQDDCSSKPAQAKFAKPYLEKQKSQKKGWWSGSGCTPELKFQPTKYIYIINNIYYPGVIMYTYKPRIQKGEAGDS